MVKWIAVAVLLASITIIISVLTKQTKYHISIKKLTLHWICAAIMLFLLHTIELTSASAVPMTPLSLATIAVLGIPGLALVQSVYILM